MEYKLINAKQEAVKVSEDKKSINVDYTITGQAVDGDIVLPINDGCTINLPIPEDLVDQAEKKVIEWFNNKYKSQ